ncbi:MAG: hypothetical protein O3A63_03820 [Proteobacteria bacterium]|nr:hypothetical protein [Pseudomonadota bacterium]
MTEPAETQAPASSNARNLIFKLVTWVIAIGCFYLVYTRVEAAAARESMSAADYMIRFFGEADWGMWLMIMVPYSVFFFVVDAHATWRVIRWFNTPDIRLRNILPIRASAYILSLVNEQVGKGAMTLYLLKRYKVPGWEALSSMIFLGFMEIYQLLIFSAIGVLIGYELVQEASTMRRLDIILPVVFIIAFTYLPLHIWYFSGSLLKNSKLRDKALLRAFRQAKPTHYLLVFLFKAPNLLFAVLVYTTALKLFQVDVGLGQMLAFLPVIFMAAALPLPFHAGALLLWTVLFPDYPEVGAFSLVMHTFFVVFNAVIGVLFLPKANKELFGDEEASQATG